MYMPIGYECARVLRCSLLEVLVLLTPHCEMLGLGVRVLVPPFYPKLQGDLEVYF